MLYTPHTSRQSRLKGVRRKFIVKGYLRKNMNYKMASKA
jgi:hypothetical protein